MLVSSWADTTSIVIVRHPMARLASIYYQNFVKLATHQTWAPKIKMIISKFGDDPKSGDQVHAAPEESVHFASLTSLCMPKLRSWRRILHTSHLSQTSHKNSM
jgi:hypothetical protein